ncbi:MAG: DEAD/DEAH box helicase family protein [Candidatus Accumulibacter propinquus]|jgi:DNA repair protein RadD
MSQQTLFDRDADRYDSATFPVPRPFQVDAHEALRQGIRDGHKNQMLDAPTGSGKTYLGLRVAHEALLRGRRVIFCCDRTTLIEQTGAAADRYGLSAHGVVQANHWRHDRHARLQIASIQTLASRGWPDADVIVVDEAHTQHRASTEHIKTCRASVIGLSATPFSPISLHTSHVA